jgi:hypothetical protein
MEQKCIWSNRKSSALKEISIVTLDRLGRNPSPRTYLVLPEHEAQFRHFNDKYRRFGRVFFWLIVFCLIVLMIGGGLTSFGGIQAGLELTGAGLLFMGVLIVVLPFTTPETVRSMGVARSIKLAKILGWVTALLGAGFCLMGLLVRVG